MRTALTHGELADTDWSVDRLNNDGAYAKRFDEVLALAQQPAPAAGLAPVEWQRLAALMLGPCFAVRPQQAPSIPLTAPIPNRSVHLQMQRIQRVFACAARSQSGKNALIKAFKAASPDERSLTRLPGLVRARASASGADDKPPLMASAVPRLGLLGRSIEYPLPRR